jgi:hypothetical protein
MPEPDNMETGLETGGNDEGAWYEGNQTITSNADLLAFAKKFDDPGKMAQSGYALEKKLGSSFRLPDDLSVLNEEQRADLMAKTRSLRKIPDKPEGYEIKVPEGTKVDEAFVSAFKNLAHEKGLSGDDVQSLADFYNNAMSGAKEKYDQQLERDAKAAETQFRMKHGAGYEKVMQGIEITRNQLADELGLAYMVDGQKMSKLDDALDMVDANGRRLGDNPAILDLFDHVYNKLYREASPIPGTQEPGATGDGVFSDGFYNRPIG